MSLEISLFLNDKERVGISGVPWDEHDLAYPYGFNMRIEECYVCCRLTVVGDTGAVQEAVKPSGMILLVVSTL